MAYVQRTKIETIAEAILDLTYTDMGRVAGLMLNHFSITEIEGEPVQITLSDGLTAWATEVRDAFERRAAQPATPPTA
jgi:hypothetical protein